MYTGIEQCNRCNIIRDWTVDKILLFLQSIPLNERWIATSDMKMSTIEKRYRHRLKWWWIYTTTTYANRKLCLSDISFSFSFFLFEQFSLRKRENRIQRFTTFRFFSFYLSLFCSLFSKQTLEFGKFRETKQEKKRIFFFSLLKLNFESQQKPDDIVSVTVSSDC